MGLVVFFAMSLYQLFIGSAVHVVIVHELVRLVPQGTREGQVYIGNTSMTSSSLQNNFHSVPHASFNTFL